MHTQEHVLPSLTLPYRGISRFQSVVVSAWVVLVTSADLKRLVPYIHWYGTLVLVLLLVFQLPQARWKEVLFPLVAGSLMVLSVLMLSFVSSTPGYEVLEAGKFAVMLLIVLPLMTTGDRTIAAALRGARVAIYLNAGLLLAGALGASQLAGLMAPGRFGTILATPGSLWRVGILWLAAGALRYFSGIRAFHELPLLLVTLALLLIDGSRTVFLILAGGVIALSIVLVRNVRVHSRRGSRFAILGRLAIVVILVVPIAIVGTSLLFQQGDVGFAERGTAMMNAIVSQDSDNVRNVDSGRAEMLTDTLAAIQQHPLIGSGMGQTKSQSPIGAMVVHFAYLQLWADGGILTFLSFTTLVVGCIPFLWRRHRRRAAREPDRLIAFYSGIFLLVCWMVACCFHAVSSEISEWIMFILGYAAVVTAGTGPSHPAVSRYAVMESTPRTRKLERTPQSFRSKLCH